MDPLTSVEATCDGHADDLESEEGGHAGKDLTGLVVEGVGTDDMDDGARRDEEGGRQGFEEVEVGALL